MKKNENFVREKFMDEALKEAKIAENDGEVPVGAVIVQDEKIISRGHNMREIMKNGLYHAEIIAIDRACKSLGSWRLCGCEIYVTLEPCAMCAGAIINSRINSVIYGADDEKSGSIRSLTHLFEIGYNHTPNVISGIKKEECSAILTNFFRSLRKKA